MRTAFVLSGGAALGAAQAGKLRGLYEHGVTPDLLVGTSVGALNAAYVASRPQTPATADALGRVWLGLRRAANGSWMRWYPRASSQPLRPRTRMLPTTAMPLREPSVAIMPRVR